MASPPLTPVFPRQPSTDSRRQSADYFASSPIARSSSYQSRRSSAAYSPIHSRTGSSHGGDSLANELGGFGESLANELGDWEEGDGEDVDYASDEDDTQLGPDGERERDSGVDVTSSPVDPSRRQSNGLLTVAINNKRGHRRKTWDYDGSEYGSESDFEEANLVSASLEARLAAVESLARRGTGDVSGQESVIVRATKQLQDLGAQSGIEAGSTRLTTAHTAISTHLTHQTRLLQQLTSTLLSPLVLPLLPQEYIDEIIPAIDATIELMPTLAPTAITSASLHSLREDTQDLIDALSSTVDSLHMMRQSSVVATRRSRAVKDALREWRIESNERDNGVRFIEQGCWDQRLKQRECASVCRDVLSGFEETCGMWRERLLASSTAAG